METFDVKYNGQDGILAINGKTVTLQVKDGVVINSELLSVSMIGTERLKLVWDAKEGRNVVTIKVISAPANRVYHKILESN